MPDLDGAGQWDQQDLRGSVIMLGHAATGWQFYMDRSDAFGSIRRREQSGSRPTEVKVAMGELGQFADATDDAQPWEGVATEILQHCSGEVAHVQQHVLGQIIELHDHSLGGNTGARGHVLVASSAGNVDASADAGDPRKARIGHDNIGDPQDRQSTHDL